MSFSLLAGLPQPGTSQDRYRDFRRVFLGSDEGKRVLSEMLTWCHLHKPSLQGNPIDPYAVVLREGERNLGLRLIQTLTVPPVEKPQKRES